MDESRGAELGRELEHDRFQAAGVARVKASREFRDRVAGVGEPRDLGGGRPGRRFGLEARCAGHHSQAGQFPLARINERHEPVAGQQFQWRVQGEAAAALRGWRGDHGRRLLAEFRVAQLVETAPPVFRDQVIGIDAVKPVPLRGIARPRFGRRIRRRRRMASRNGAERGRRCHSESLEEHPARRSSRVRIAGLGHGQFSWKVRTHFVPAASEARRPRPVTLEPLESEKFIVQGRERESVTRWPQNGPCTAPRTGGCSTSACRTQTEPDGKGDRRQGAGSPRGIAPLGASPGEDPRRQSGPWVHGPETRGVIN